MKTKEYNIVTCGECGIKFAHLKYKEYKELECYQCGCKGELCDFPDYYEDEDENTIVISNQ